MQGRLRRTARFIALTTYGGKADAEAAIGRVRRVHDRIRGVLPDGTPYAANEPSLLAWVHVTEVTSFLDAWIRYVEPGMSAADQDRYFAEMARVGRALGANPIPHSWSDAQILVKQMRPHLLCNARTREVATRVLTQPAPNVLMEPFQTVCVHAAVDLLPSWARQMHGLTAPPLSGLLARASTMGIARTVRWALR
jgi:uncharacterized protein (DUF2236 family)